MGTASTTTTPTITRDEYARRRRHNYAGPALELLPATRARWTAGYWMLQQCDAGTSLVPVEVAR